MKLDIDNIKRGEETRLDLKFNLAPYSIDFYGDTIDIISPVDVDGELYIIDFKLYINLKIKTDMQVNCHRCLEPFTYPFSSSIDAEIIDEDLFDYEEDDAYEDIIYYKENILDLEDLVKDHIIMNLPIKFICKEECQGLCPQCGANLGEASCDCSNMESLEDNIDPRLAKLKVLLQEDKD